VPGDPGAPVAFAPVRGRSPVSQRFAPTDFFTSAFLEYIEQRRPIAEAVTVIAQDWFNALRKAVEETQEKREINPKVGPKQITRELNGLLVGAHWGYVLKHGDCWGEARLALLRHLRKLATGEIPSSVFSSERNWKKYSQGKSRLAWRLVSTACRYEIHGSRAGITRL
jgi:hypothetical protein